MTKSKRVSLIGALCAVTLAISIANPGWCGDQGEQTGYFVEVSAADAVQAAQGIKEALLKGTATAVQQTGRTNGFFGNPAIKILMPQRLKPIDGGLRAIGYGPKIDAFVLSMNRAAEAAAPLAEPIFTKAITGMSFTDAQRIVSGGGHSATDYFKRKTSAQLTAAFAPVVKGKMEQLQVVKQYDDLIGQYKSGPMSSMGGLLGGSTPSVDVNSYVTQKALDGLFYMIGQEEQTIRTNPAAQVTPLLRQVFGGMQ